MIGDPVPQGGLGPRCPTHNSGHLFKTSTPARVSKRFDQVDIEAVPASLLLKHILDFELRLKGPLAYIGGKNRIASQIIRIFPQHTTYVEVFAGGAQVLFHKEPSQVEVLNDLDGDVVTFYRVCQSHYEEFLRYMRFVVASREWFDLLQNQDPKALTDIQRAARFFYLQKNAYAGLVVHRKFGYSVETHARMNPDNLPELIRTTHERLARVQIECLPYQDVVRRYDRPTTLFYLDPPYFGRKLYRYNFSESDFEELAQRLTKVRGKFVLSLNDLPEVRKLFSKFKFREIHLHYTAQREAGKRFQELLITNFVPRQRNPQ